MTVMYLVLICLWDNDKWANSKINRGTLDYYSILDLMNNISII